MRKRKRDAVAGLTFVGSAAADWNCSWAPFDRTSAASTFQPSANKNYIPLPNRLAPAPHLLAVRHCALFIASVVPQ